MFGNQIVSRFGAYFLAIRFVRYVSSRFALIGLHEGQSVYARPANGLKARITVDANAVLPAVLSRVMETVAERATQCICLDGSSCG
jgi:hypothetical protein